MFEHGVTTVVVSPLRGLMAQQVARLQLQGVDAVAANSDASASGTKYCWSGLDAQLVRRFDGWGSY